MVPRIYSSLVDDFFIGGVYMRKFEKISFAQFKKDISDDKNLYNKYELPTRKTKNSAGYDILSLIDHDLKPGESIVIPTGLKCALPNDEILLIASRSSFGYKYNVRLVNGVGIIDADFYNNESNEGHFRVKLQNHGEQTLPIKIGDAIAQGLFIKYYTVDEEVAIKNVRKGGIGSTSKGE